MTGESLAAVILGIAMLALFTALLWKKRINQPNYTILLSLTSVVCLVLHGFPRLKELDVRKMKLTLAEMKDIRADVYAKADTVARLSDRVVDVILRLTPNRSLDTIAKMEADALQLLKDSNASEKHLEETRVRFARARAREFLGALFLRASPDDGDDLPDELWSVDTYDRAKVEEWCMRKKIGVAPLSPLLDQIDREIKRVRGGKQQ